MNRSCVHLLRVGLVGLSLIFLVDMGVSAQETERFNRVIEQIEQDAPAIVGEHWQFIDMEHGPYLLGRLEERLASLKQQATTRLPITPFVRLPMEGDETARYAVKQVLDLGVFGVIFPRVETKAQAERAVSAMRYPPQRGETTPTPVGLRGWGPGRAARLWNLPVAEYVQRADLWPLDSAGELLAVIMIESAEGVANVEEIASVAGVGALFIGPVDLAMSLGVGPPGPTLAPETETAIQTVLRACKNSGVVCGMADSKTRSQQRISEGFRLLLPF